MTYDKVKGSGGASVAPRMTQTQKSGGVVDGDRNLERNGGVWGVGIEMGVGMT